jgi:hypothetical protein
MSTNVRTREGVLVLLPFDIESLRNSTFQPHCPRAILTLNVFQPQEVILSFELVNSAVARPANNVTLNCGASDRDNDEDGDSISNSTNSTNSKNSSIDSEGGDAVGTCAPVAFPPRTAVAAALRVRALPRPVCAKPMAFGPPACTGICQGIVSGGACLCPPRRFGDDCGRVSDPDGARSTTALVRGGAVAAVEGGGGDGVEIPAGALVGDFLVSVDVYPVMPEPGPGQVIVQLVGKSGGERKRGRAAEFTPVSGCNEATGQWG